MGFEFESLAVDVVDRFFEGLVLEGFDLAAVVTDDVMVMMT